jgi:hypothetical protein
LDAGDYAVDTSRVYYAGVPVRGADVSSFEAMGPALASDKSKMYVGGDRYEGEIGADWNVLDIASLRSRVIEHQFAKSAAEGDASAMSALARNALKQDDAYQALVWARIVPIFGGKRLKKLEDEARYMLDPHEELPELVPDVSLSTAKMLWIGTEVPRRSEEARLHLANALREGLLTLTTFTRESLVEQFGEEVVVSAEAIASGPPARKRTAKSGSS